MVLCRNLVLMLLAGQGEILAGATMCKSRILVSRPRCLEEELERLRPALANLGKEVTP